MIRLSIMGFPDRGEKNLTSSTSSCKNFQPNMFNKTKCQNCFRTREAHAVNPDDANNKPKKVMLCGYLYVAPGIDFDNPLSRSRKWQRRCFIFYENGDLCYALDDDPNTIPQGVVNMYQCTNVFDADQKTGKEFSMGIVTPDETTYIRAETREEKDSWYNTLAEYPEINRQEEKLRKKRAKAMSYGQPISNKQEIQADKPRVESTTIAVTAKPPDPIIKSSESSQLPMDNQPATQDKVSSTTEKQGLESSTRLGQSNLGNTGLRRSQSETTTNRPKRYPEIIDTSAPSRSKKESLIDQEAGISRRNSAPVRKREDGSPEKGDAEKNKSNRSRRYRSDGTQLGDPKRSGRRSRFHTIDVTPTKESVDGNNVDVPVDSTQEELTATTNSQTSVLHRNNNNVNIEPSLSSQDTNKQRPVDIAPLATQEDLDVDPEGRARTLSDLSSHSSEDLERMDNPRKPRLGLKITQEHADSPSPSKRTIQRRKHAIVRRSRHTLDGSMHIPTPSASDDSESSKDGPTLKRSNSDPSLAESNDMMQRKQIAMTFPGLFHLKKGWLIKQGEAEQDFSKHWFVLCDNKLSYYRDSTDEDDKNKDGEIELSTCQEARETDVSRNYGFQIKTANGIIILAAMTRGIRDNWVQAINKALVTAQEDKSKDTPSSEDKSVEGVISRKQASSTESAISDPTDSSERTSDKRRSSINREKGRERRSRRSSRELRDFKRLSVDSVDLPSMKSSNGENDSGMSTSTPVSKEKTKAQFVVDERELLSRNSTQGDTAVMELLETEVESLKTKLESTQMERVRVQQENAELRALMNAVQREHKDNFEDLENEHTAYITQIEQLAEKQDELSEKNAKYEQQTQRLQMELKQSKNKAGLLEQQNEQLEERLFSTATDLEERERECNDLKNRLHAAKATTKDGSEIEQASSIIEQLNDRIGLLEQELNNSRTRCSDLEDDIIAKSREINTLHQREKNNESKQTAETEIVHMLRMQLQEAHERLQESEQDCISNEERFGKRYNRLETKFQAEKAALEEKLEEAEATIKSLTSQTKEERVSPSRGNFDSVVPLSPLPPDASMEEIGLKLAEREQQLMDLRRQLKKEVTSKSVLQEKYDDLVAKPAQLNVEGQANVDSSVLRGLESELESARKENKRLTSELEKERAGGKTIHEKLAAESLAKSELADKFKSLYKLAQKQQEELKVARAAQTPEGAQRVLSERNAIIMKLQEELRKQIAEKQNLNKSVHTLSGDLATFQAQLAGKDQDVSKLKEQLQESESQNARIKQVLQTNVSQITTLKQQLGGLEGMRDELRQLQAQIEKEKGEYTIELQNKEDQLTVATDKLSTVQAELKSLETKLREAEQASTQTENDFEKRMLELQTESEDVQKKFDRSEKEVKRLRNELKVSQGAYDELDLKALQAREDIKRLERTNSEQTELMGQRIQDLTNKLAASERKVRDLQNMEQKARFVHGGSSRGSPVQAALIENKLKEVESKLGDVENAMETQDIESNNLQGKINSVEQQVEAREAEPTSAEQTSSEDRSSPLVIRDSSSSTQQSTSGPDDTDSSSSPDTSVAETNPAHRAKVLESKLAETENKLKEVTRKLVDVTTKQLEDRKTNQTRRATENKLKEQVKELEKKVEELSYSLEKAREKNASPATHKDTKGTNFVTTSRNDTYVNFSPFIQQELDSEKFVEKEMFLQEMLGILSLLMNIHRYVDGTKESPKMSANVVFERNEVLSSAILFQAETNVVQHKSGHSSSTTYMAPRKACHKSASEPVYATVIPRSARISRRTQSRVTFRRKQGSSTEDDSGVVAEDVDDPDYSLVMPRRHSDPAEISDMGWSSGSGVRNEVSLSQKELVELHRRWIGTVDLLKEKYELVLECVLSAKTDIIGRIGHALAKRSMDQKVDGDFVDGVEYRNVNKREVGACKRDIGSTMDGIVGGWDAELAAYAEEIAFHEAMTVAMDYVSNEIVLAEAMQGLHARSKQLHEIVESEAESCSKVLNHFKKNACRRYECIQKGLEDAVITTSEEVRQSYYDMMGRMSYTSEFKDSGSSDSLSSLISTLADMMLTIAVVDGIVNYLTCQGCDVGFDKKANTGLGADLDIMDGIPSPRTPSPCELADEIDLIDLNTEALAPENVNVDSKRVSQIGNRFSGFEDLWGESEDLEQSLLNSEAEDFAILLADKAIAHAEAVYMTDCIQGEWENAVEASHMSVIETMTAEHSHNITSIRQRYETILREEQESHTSELALIQEKYSSALQRIQNLEDGMKKVVALHSNKPDIKISMVQDINEMVEEMIANKVKRIETDMEATRIRLREAQMKLEIQSEEHVQEVDAITGIMETMEKKYKEELKSLRTQYIERVEELETSMRTRLERQRDIHEARLVEVVRRNRSEISRLYGQQHSSAQLTAKVRSNGELVEQEKSHREKLSELRDSFQEQLKLIQEEKDKQLNEEAQATAKVIASLQEKHEQEIEQERLNLQGGINSDVEAVMKRHREVVNQMNKEWQILSQKFSQVCQENTQLSRQVENLTKLLGEAQTQTEQLLTHNKELGNRLKEEVVALSSRLSRQGEEEDTEEVLQVDRNDNEQITPTKVALHIRDVELQCANEELKMVQGKLNQALEKQKLSNKLRSDLESKCQSHQDYIEALKGEVDDLQRQVQRVRTSGEGAAAQDEPEPEVV